MNSVKISCLLIIALAFGIPAAAVEYAPVPLDAYANLVPSGNDLLAPPRKGSDFDRIDNVDIHLVSLARGAKTQCAVGLMGDQPTAVRGIPVGYSGVKSFHFFHSVLKGSFRPGSIVCKYVVHYRSGKVAEVPVIAGQNIGSSRIAQGVPKARAVQAVVDGEPRASFVYHMEWNNPFPKEQIATMDIIAVSPSVLTALSALTVELNPLKKTPPRLVDSINTLNRLWRDLRTQSESAGILLFSENHSAATTRSLQGIIESADAARKDVLSLRKSVRAAAETGGSEPKDLKARLSALSSKRNSIQEALTRVVRSQ